MRILRWLFLIVTAGAITTVPACSCDSHVGAPDGFRPGGDGFVQLGSISIDPPDVTLDLVQGMAPPSQVYKVTYHGSSKDTDISGDATVMYKLTDMTLGIVNSPPNTGAPTFVAGTDHGGTTTLIANWDSPDGPATGQATIHVRVHGGFSDTSCMSNCNFPGDNAPPCATGAAPTIVYPTDGVLLPPNLNSLEVQFTPGAGDTMFELDFQNSATDVRVTTKCNPTIDTRGQMSGGCKVDLEKITNTMTNAWDFIAKSNKGGDPITITIRATTDGMCASPSKNTIKMSIAEEDIQGGIYYWKSIVTSTGTGGNIWRKDFGNTMPEQEISPVGVNNFTCLGCHALSRDGTRMAVNGDDADSDDEYNDVTMGDVNISTQKFINATGYGLGHTPGFETFSADGKYFLSSNGRGGTTNQIGGGGNNAPSANVMWLWNASDGSAAMPNYVAVGMATDRPTMPDWSGDNKNVVFVMPKAVGWNDGSVRKDDAHVYGGSLWTMPYLGMGTFGPASPLITSNGDNNYYPSYSPDGAFIVYNHVPAQMGALTACTTGSCPNDSFSNPKARMMLLPTGGGVVTPIDLEQANGSAAASPVDVSNSWPRWTPFLQTYKGSKLLWITFSTTRDYGLRVRNHVMVGGQNLVQCYPSDSAEEPNQSHGMPFPTNCQQPQIWMAAINLSTAEVSGNGDPSYPAFWLPFQDITTHNHSAQWTQQVVVTPPPTDGGACIPAGGDCTMNPNGCCADAPTCTGNGTCGIL